MKIEKDDRGRVVLEPDGIDSRIVSGEPVDTVIVITRESVVIECWEEEGKIHWRRVTATDLAAREKPG